MTVALASDTTVAWSERNQRWLVSRFAALRECIPDRAAKPFREMPEDDEQDFVPALQRCAELFGLSRFERDVLLLCAGVALDAGLADAVARAGGHAQGRPTFPFAMSLLEAPHWDALSPQAPLRHWQLLHLDGALPTEAALRIDERMLHYLSGVAAIDERLDGMVELVAPPDAEAEAEPAAWIAQVVATFAMGGDCVQLQRTGEAPGRDDVLQLLAATGRHGVWVRDLPEDPVVLAPTLRLVDREAALSAALVVLDLRGPTPRLDRIAPQLRSPLLVLAAADTDIGATPGLRSVWLPAATPASRARELAVRARRFGASLPAEALETAVAEACEQFAPGSGRALDDAARAIAGAGDAGDARQRAWAALREHSREGLDRLAQRIESTTTLDDLVLPPAQAGLLADIGRQLQQRRRVYRDWGFAGKGARGLGIAALFTGESGTGKTMAAEAIANAAGLDLYRIDLAGTVSKYIGETEKNLRRIFDAAEASGAVLLFDEADALFGKRSEVKDSHDRYANIETAYLLQRIEAYRGLAILTTNMKGAIDKAFLRRIRFVVQFPFPDEAARDALWRRQFPAQAPLSEDIRWPSLARMPLAGGNIRAVALNAAFIAAHEDVPIAQRHLAAAAHAELAKLERSPGPQGGAHT
ncbi:ATP-binding protein [Luteimonas viscosa]|uniref:ATP-binding protein n=1 Tax=Luteimonas viscosa TaxID=1132694 RepID=A0A5D4XIR7_9GAMM|nr:ATP-binding protein [Luteimonas viscosa]TYT23825.1 ATP-binding protein [Luteimonas viscosa]